MERTLVFHAVVRGSIPRRGEEPFTIIALLIQEIVIAAIKKIEIV